MSSSTPSDPEPQQGDPPVDPAEPEPDEADTGPIQQISGVGAVEGQAQSDEQEWQQPRFDGPPLAGPSFASQFDAQVVGRPVARRRLNAKPFLIGAAVVGAVALTGGLVFWLVRPDGDDESPDSGATAAPTATPTESNVTEADVKLRRYLPKGYPAGACSLADAPEDALSQFECGPNNDPGGPRSATYTLMRDRAALESSFTEAIAAATRVDCPNRIQSPGPWRRNATPDKVSGTLFCGLRDDRPTVIWSDVDRLTLNIVDAGPEGPSFPQLYAWWSSHS